MTVYMHNIERDGRKFICSTFNNSNNEQVTIYHDNGGIFQQHWHQGEVEYQLPSEATLSQTIGSDAKESMYGLGKVIQGVWRPGLCLDIPVALKIDELELRRAKSDLKILIDKLHEILLFVEPDTNGLQAYGHKIRELLILACTEVESSWISYFRLAGQGSGRLSTNDYVKLNEKLRLFEYQVSFKNHPFNIQMKPFDCWDAKNPTKSLAWYDAYNKTKHNKAESFSCATLDSCFHAIAANIVMFCARYSPYELLEKNDVCSNSVNEHFVIELIDPSIEYFYVPSIKSVSMASGAFSAPMASTFENGWSIIPLSL
ncbi:hypothetical protein C0Z01_11360 [Photobacterium kishitanii]|uniref:hypothetical protein n=1 Tax=Photobacterium kishitanii TaxID=318456 RepID=UPI0007EFFB2B|nr:hypothetical protein [Photobacterium kishitanii]OBU29070.1 hypothetical protein AYY22_00605 [Photobacterium kishitanii]PSW69397.1 hypothetical protein C0Z01_11360 [Photobacterium kishitanii]